MFDATAEWKPRPAEMSAVRRQFGTHLRQPSIRNNPHHISKFQLLLRVWTLKFFASKWHKFEEILVKANSDHCDEILFFIKKLGLQ